MVYTTTSIKPVIGKILRNTRLQDMTYADDFIEWIGEGLNFMLVRWRLNQRTHVATIKNHSAPLPCGLQTLNGVIYQGARLRLGTGQIDVRVQPFTAETDVSSYFQHDTEVTPEDVNDQNYIMTRGLNVKQIQSIVINDFYQLQYNHIKTSFKEGEVVLLYRKLDTDSEGYPLIPDLEEAREGLFWYVCSRLVFTGYKLPDASMTFDYCDKKATYFLGQAKKIIKEQSTDEKESTLQLLNNLIPPSNYYETFFIGGEQRKYVNK